MVEEMDKINFIGMSKDEINEERKEYACLPLAYVTDVTDMKSAANIVM